MSAPELDATDSQPAPAPLTESTQQSAHVEATDSLSLSAQSAPTPSSLSPPPAPSLPAAVFAHMWWLGGAVLHGLEYVGEALADFLGITSSPYQYVIDAKERQERWERMEEAEEEAARVKLEDEQKQQQSQQSSRMEEGHTTALDPLDAHAPSPSLPDISTPADSAAIDDTRAV